MTSSCKSWDFRFERNCLSWRPHINCGFRDISATSTSKVYEKVDKLLVKIDQRKACTEWFGTEYCMANPPLTLDEIHRTLDEMVLEGKEDKVMTTQRTLPLNTMPDPSDDGREGNAMDTQVGGGHYKDMIIQPTEYCQKNKLNACESNIVKYASRHLNKNGLEDVKKIKHYAELLAWITYREVI